MVSPEFHRGVMLERLRSLRGSTVGGREHHLREDQRYEAQWPHESESRSPGPWHPWQYSQEGQARTQNKHLSGVNSGATLFQAQGTPCAPDLSTARTPRAREGPRAFPWRASVPDAQLTPGQAARPLALPHAVGCSAWLAMSNLYRAASRSLTHPGGFPRLSGPGLYSATNCPVATSRNS
jgi:hypothetical protein